MLTCEIILLARYLRNLPLKVQISDYFLKNDFVLILQRIASVWSRLWLFFDLGREGISMLAQVEHAADRIMPLPRNFPDCCFCQKSKGRTIWYRNPREEAFWTVKCNWCIKPRKGESFLSLWVFVTSLDTWLWKKFRSLSKSTPPRRLPFYPRREGDKSKVGKSRRYARERMSSGRCSR